MVYNLDILNICKFHLFDPAVPAEDELLFAHAAVSGHVEDHEEVVDKGGVHPDTSITQHTQYPESRYHGTHATSCVAPLLVRLPLLIPEQRLADGRELVNVDGAVPALKHI